MLYEELFDADADEFEFREKDAEPEFEVELGDVVLEADEGELVGFKLRNASENIEVREGKRREVEFWTE